MNNGRIRTGEVHASGHSKMWRVQTLVDRKWRTKSSPPSTYPLKGRFVLGRLGEIGLILLAIHRAKKWDGRSSCMLSQALGGERKWAEEEFSRAVEVC